MDYIIGCSVIGLNFGLIYGLIYSLITNTTDDHVIISCIILAVIIGAGFGYYRTKIDYHFNEVSKIQSELINTKLELERIKEQAVAAGLGYWREETAIIKREFLIASQTTSFTAEVK